MYDSRRDRRGFSLVEVILALAILAFALVPIIQLFTSTHRIGHSARRMLEVTLHVQSLIEGLAELEPADFPPIGAGEEKTLMSDELAAAGAGGPKFADIRDFFARPVPVPGMKRMVVGNRLATGELELRVEVEWEAVVGEERTLQRIVLPMLSIPRNWQ